MIPGPALPIWTVVGLLDLDRAPALLYVAAVLEGEHPTCDSSSNSGAYGELQRWATNVQATTADEAEALAIADEDDVPT